MAEKGMGAGGIAIGPGLKDNDQIADVRGREFHLLGKNIQGVQSVLTTLTVSLFSDFMRLPIHTG